MPNRTPTHSELGKFSTKTIARCLAHLAIDSRSRRPLLTHLAGWGISLNDLRGELVRRELSGAGL